MQVEICKWGNSLAVRIPASVIAEANIGEGTRLEVKVESSGAIALMPMHANPTLQQLMDEVTSSNLHGETETGLAVGREVW